MSYYGQWFWSLVHKSSSSTSSVQCTLGTIKDGGREMPNNVLVAYLTGQYQRIALLVENQSGKNLIDE